MNRFAPIFVFCLAAASLSYAAPKIETIAGTGEQGYSGDGGKGTEAKLDNPFGVIVAPDGDIIFCDTINHVIRRISRKNGNIDTIVGTGEKGYEGNGTPPLETKLFEPYEVRYHPSGDLYWVEMRNNIVRKLDAKTNRVELVAGNGKAGFSGDDGPATEAAMNNPHSIQFDAAGENLFICDIKNHRIRKVELKTGVITTWCGTGKAEPTENGAPVSPDTPLKGPRAFDIAPNGDLWLALREGNQVYRIDMKELKLYHVAGTGKKGFHAEEKPALESELSGPKGVAISPDGKLIYLADTESHTARAIDLSQNPPTLKLIAGTGKRGDGPDSPDPLACGMARLHGVGTDPITGDLYIGDSETHKVRMVTGLPGGKMMALGEYETEEFELAGRKCKVTKPKNAAPGNPWIWRCRFYGAFPSVDQALLAKGWHVAWIDVANEFGGPEAMKAFDSFYSEVRGKYALSEKPIIEGFSRGGLPATFWPIANPDKVAGIYIDAPVLDIHSWPGESSKLWETCLGAWGLDKTTAGSWTAPYKKLKPLADHDIPIMIVAGGADEVVPWADNGSHLVEEYQKLGGPIQAIVKSAAGHHPHSLHDPTPVVEWAIAAVKGS